MAMHEFLRASITALAISGLTVALSAAEPAPAPSPVERPQRAHQPSGVVVPGDPTLN